MTAVGELVLVLGLLVSAHCKVRARDPEEELREEQEEELRGRAAAAAGLLPGETQALLVADRGQHPTRTGNWCAFTQQRVVTQAVACGTEKYTIKSQSPCPSGSPDCQVVMYKLSTRPIYRQQQKLVNVRLWGCCPGHGGENCDTVLNAQADAASSPLTGGPEPQAAPAELRTPGTPEQLQLHRIDPNREQNDHDTPVRTPHDPGHLNDPGHRHDPGHPIDPGNATRYQHDPAHPHDLGHPHDPGNATHHDADPGRPHATHRHTDARHHPQHRPQEQAFTVDAATIAAAVPVLPVPDMMDLVMSQLRPLLEGFNRSLEHLSRQVGDLARDVAHLKMSQLEAEQDEAAEERLDARLDEVFQHIREVRRQMESQRTETASRLHLNLTTFKTDVDMKLKHQQEMLQVSLQAMNASLAVLKLDQDQIQDPAPEDQPEDLLAPPVLPLQLTDTSALWEAIERLDNMVVNNTVKVNGLMEDADVAAGGVQQLKQDVKVLQGRINQTARNSQIQFMETGLEVEAAKVAVLTRVDELAGNLSQQGQRLQDVDVDLDYLFTAFYKHNSTGDCDCQGLKAAVKVLERGVANVTELANENRLALDEESREGVQQWGGVGDWEPAVGALQQGLQQMKESLAYEQSRTRTLDQSQAQLSSLVTVATAELAGLRLADGKLNEQMGHLSGFFNSLLKDVIRHSDVLELLLGEEVLEFLEWRVQEQEAHSIPALKEQLRRLREQLDQHSLLLGDRPGREEEPSADQPSSSWLPGGAPARERQLLLHHDGGRPQLESDGSDLWNLEKAVEELKLKLQQLEERQANATGTAAAAPAGGEEAALQAEVRWLKRGLEEHLRMFKNVFSNADVLAGSDATLELDKLWQLVRGKDERKEKKRGRGGGGGHRSRREAAGDADLLGQSDVSLLLIAGAPRRGADGGVITFDASLNNAGFYSESGTFTAPVDGVYLFVLSLDLEPGAAHVTLRASSDGAERTLLRQHAAAAGAVTRAVHLRLREGEKLRLELRRGAWAESPGNGLAVLLFHRDT